jgi:hypothetical protein
MLKSDDLRLVTEGLDAVGDFQRPEDVELVVAMLEDKRVAYVAVNALAAFEPLRVEQLANLLDHPQPAARRNAFMALRGLSGGKDLTFNANATGDEVATEKQRVIDWLAKNGHLKKNID